MTTVHCAVKETPDTKMCLKCKEYLPAASFYKRKNQCKGCVKKYNKSQYNKMKNLRREKVLEYHQKNKEWIREKKKKYAQKHKEKIAAYQRAWRAKNRENRRTYARTYYKENGQREKSFGRRLRVEYSMTLEEYRTLLESQGHKCAICNEPFVGKGKEPSAPCVDHCHTEGSVRGILCGFCNRGIGLFKDSPERLVSAAKYLSSQREP